MPLQESNTKEYNMPLERFTIYPQQNQMELLNDCLEKKNNENDPTIIFLVLEPLDCQATGTTDLHVLIKQ